MRTHTPTYYTWARMFARCRRNPWYVKRGISVCKRWHSFEKFYADMRERPNGLTLERINNAGNYTPKNCRWASMGEQCRNRRSNVWITYKGERLCCTDACVAAGVNYNTMKSRFYQGRSATQQEAFDFVLLRLRNPVEV